MDFPIPMEDDKWRPEARVRGRSVDGRESDAELEVRVPAPTTVEDGVSVSRAVMERVFDGWRCTEGREPRPNCSHSIEKGSVRHMVVCAAGNLLFIQSHELRWRSKHLLHFQVPLPRSSWVQRGEALLAALSV